MRRLFHRLQPFTSDAAGAMAVFADTPAMVVSFDMSGNSGLFDNRVGLPLGAPVQYAASRGCREIDYVLGDTEHLMFEAKGCLEQFGGEYLVLLQGPVSALVGADLELAARDASEELACRVISVDVNGSDYYDEGLEKAMVAVYEQLLREGISAEGQARGGINILGVNCVDHADARLRQRIIDGCARLEDKEVLSVWGCRDCWTQWRSSAKAQLNIVASASGMRLAQIMERDWDIPYVCIDEIWRSLLSQSDATERSELNLRALIVCEQLLGNLARIALEEIGVKASVATFFKAVPGAMREDDLCISGEEELAALLRSGDYDVLVGDPALQTCLPLEGDLLFVPLTHSPVSRVGLAFDGPWPLSDEWLEMTLSILGS